MSSILLVTWDGGGNVPPALGIGAELRRRGHHVRVLGHPAQAGAVEAAGLAFEPYRHARPFSPLRRLSPPRWAAAYLGLFTDRGIGTDVTEALRREPTELTIVDAMLLGALDAVRRAGARHAVLMHTLHNFMVGRWAGGPLGLVSAIRRLSPQPLWSAAERVIVSGLAELEPAGTGPANVRYTGPVWPIGAPAPTPYQKTDPRILVSLSTIHYNGQSRVLGSIMDAVAELAVPVVLTTGHCLSPEEIRAPRNVDVHRFLPHHEIMPKVSLVIGHGGHSTTMLALAHDLPLMITPLSALGDQPAVGAAVERAGAGVVVPKTARPDKLRAVIGRLLADGPHRNAAARLGAQIRTSDGAATAADDLESLLVRT